MPGRSSWMTYAPQGVKGLDDDDDDDDDDVDGVDELYVILFHEKFTGD